VQVVSWLGVCAEVARRVLLELREGRMSSSKSTNNYAIRELAAAYDVDCEGRRDLPFYVGLAAELHAARVADIGCGTGLLCNLLAHGGREVIGVEPEQTMLSLAGDQEHSNDISWIHGTAEQLPSGWADLVIMTGHVAQYFLDDQAWADTLAHARRALRAGGRVGFEFRNPQIDAWKHWQSDGPVPTSRGTVRQEVERDGDLITHIDHWTQGENTWTTSETLRFPSWPSIMFGLDAAGLSVERSWGDWDRSPINANSPEWIILTGPM
jgi:SAM-dependent methyltransferase